MSSVVIVFCSFLEYLDEGTFKGIKKNFIIAGALFIFGVLIFLYDLTSPKTEEVQQIETTSLESLNEYKILAPEGYIYKINIITTKSTRLGATMHDNVEYYVIIEEE